MHKRILKVIISWFNFEIKCHANLFSQSKSLDSTKRNISTIRISPKLRRALTQYSASSILHLGVLHQRVVIWKRTCRLRTPYSVKPRQRSRFGWATPTREMHQELLFSKPVIKLMRTNQIWSRTKRRAIRKLRSLLEAILLVIMEHQRINMKGDSKMRRSNKELPEFFSLEVWVTHLTRLKIATTMAVSQLRWIILLCRGQWLRKKIPGRLNQNMTGSSQKVKNLRFNESISRKDRKNSNYF